MTAHLISKRVTALPAPFVETAAGIHMVNPKLQQTSHRKPEFKLQRRSALHRPVFSYADALTGFSMISTESLACNF